MSKKNRIEACGSSLGLAVFLNVMNLLLVLFLCDIKYEVSDDFVMATIISGGYGNGFNPHLMFANTLLGDLLLPLYHLIPSVSWYFVFQILLIFVSSTIVAYMLLEKLDKPQAVAFIIVLFLFFTNDAYILVQFTKTAMFAVMSGAVLFLTAVFTDHSKKKMVIGGLVCLLGTMVRFNTIYIAGGFIILILGYEFIKIFARRKEEPIQKNKIICIIISGVLLIGLAFGCKWISQRIYYNDEEYRYFKEYSTARADIVDSTYYGYDFYAEELQEIGISENDYNMIRQWSFADESVFSLEQMQKVAEIISTKNAGQHPGFKSMIKEFLARGLMKYPVFLACLILFMVNVLGSKKKVVWNIMACAIGVFYALYFIWAGRTVYRVEFGVFLGVFLSLVYFTDKISAKNKLSIKIVSVGIALLSILTNVTTYIPDKSYTYVDSDNKKEYIDSTFLYSWNYDSRKYRTAVSSIEAESALLTEIHENSDKFYFLDFSTTIQTLYYDWAPWENVKQNEYGNYLYLGGVTTNFPDVNNVLENNEITSSLQSLIEDDIYLVDNCYVDVKLEFLREHYYPNARAELYKEVDGYQIWKFYVE